MAQEYRKEIETRRTFAIISHPDAGKTTLTEKFLLYGGAINTAGSVKGKANSKYAVSDWMGIEKERGISVTSSVLQFNYDGYCINILDTPGHQDFSEDTYRTLMAADSAVMVIDASKGVEAQTIKLFKVCVMRHIPIFTFINKMDLEAKDSFELLDDIETVLGIRTCPVNWPIGAGKRFKGVYDRETRMVNMFQAVSVGGAKSAAETDYGIDDPKLKEAVGDELYQQLMDEIELLDGASDEFNQEKVDRGELTPVFFGSALTTFGIETFLEHFLKMTSSPLPRLSNEGVIDPLDAPFSGFIFKIQANMNKAHHDRIAFMRICSGKFDASKDVYHVQSGRKLKLSQPQQIMAQDRKVIEEAYAGDVIGVFDPGIFSIGDTICAPGKKFEYEGIPTFAPEHFCRLVSLDSMKRKQFIKGVTQLAQEGAIQIFKDYALDLSEIIVGVVGVLQFDVLKYRLENEYNCDVRLEPLPYNYIRWVKDPATDLNKLKRISDCKKVKDMKDNPLLLFANEWSIRIVLENNEGLELEEFRKN
jgi:peptide chain release factor 3